MNVLIDTDVFFKCGGTAAVVLGTINTLANADGILPCTVSELAAQLGLSRQHIYRIINTLEYQGYITVSYVQLTGNYYKKQVRVKK